MFTKEHVFSDGFAQRKNLLTGIEARTKIAFTTIALVINLLSQSIYTSIGIAGLCLITLLLTKIPPKLLLLRLAMPLLMAAVVLITQVFFYGVTPLFAFSIWGLHLTGYEEGLARGFLIMWRVIAGVLLVLFLSMSTPAHKLFLAASWFKVPKTFIELALLVYRYIFVLLEEATTMTDAQKVRLGYHNWRQSIKSLGVLGGSLILRVYDRAERVWEAMLARCYTGNITVDYHERLGRRGYLATFCLAVILVILYLVGQSR